ncbi:hypothetical protein M569_14949, partial [Genlisea aurea]
KMKRFLSIPVLFALFLLGFVYYVTMFVFLEESASLHTSTGLIPLAFSLLGFMCLFSLIVCILTDPGGVPSVSVPDIEQSYGLENEIKRIGSNTRLCDKCSVNKPPRAHHCRVCRRCVLKMDHHCIWINNCVGCRNYNAFLLLVFYATLASAYSAIIITISMIKRDWDHASSQHSKSLHLFCGVLSGSLSFILGSLLVWHLYLTSHNMTTIEYHEAKRAAWLASKSGQTYRHPYDAGFYRNITSVFGPNVLKWFWPRAVDHVGDGVGF